MRPQNCPRNRCSFWELPRDPSHCEPYGELHSELHSRHSDSNRLGTLRGAKATATAARAMPDCTQDGLDACLPHKNDPLGTAAGDWLGKTARHCVTNYDSWQT